MLGTREHYAVMDMFERTAGQGLRLDREIDDAVKRMGHIYQAGETNVAFRMYLAGYSFGKTQHPTPEKAHD